MELYIVSNIVKEEIRPQLKYYSYLLETMEKKIHNILWMKFFNNEIL